jgi:hypothetical protein
MGIMNNNKYIIRGGVYRISYLIKHLIVGVKNFAPGLLEIFPSKKGKKGGFFYA